MRRTQVILAKAASCGRIPKLSLIRLPLQIFLQVPQIMNISKAQDFNMPTELEEVISII